MRNFNPLEVVGHISEIQLQAGGNLNKISYPEKGKKKKKITDKSLSDQRASHVCWNFIFDIFSNCGISPLT